MGTGDGHRDRGVPPQGHGHPLDAQQLREVVFKRSQIVKDYIAWPLISALAAGAARAGVEAARRQLDVIDTQRQRGKTLPATL